MRTLATLLIVCVGSIVGRAAELPNILWLTSEDNGPHLGCYGDEFSDTPNIDALAKKGVVYLNCWSTAPVCAPARTTLISGLYPPSTGSEHMRSNTRLPAAFSMYPVYLRQAGYYCTNNNKEDYNLAKDGKVWDESSRSAHWRNRPAGKPFFAIFNHGVSHESQIRRRPHKAVHDASKVRVPAYHPDTPEVRRDWAQYYDKLTEMDAQVGKRLREIEEAGLAEDTIVFYYGDHGPGMPRGKRWPYNSGLHVPLVVYIPEKYKALRPTDYVASGKTKRLVGFIDFAPTLLSLAGVQPPSHFQGHAFLGKHATAPQPYNYGFRGRMDERYDLVRAVRDQRYIYIRHFMPHKIYGQYIQYMFQTPTTRVWKEMYDRGELKAPRTHFWERKPFEELYDLESDPDEIRNLASSPEHRAVLDRLRAAQREWTLRIRDIGFLPETEIHERGATSSPYEYGQSGAYNVTKIVEWAERASSLAESATAGLPAGLSDNDSAVRYWAALGLLMREERGVELGAASLRKALGDPSPSVRVIAAEALARYGSDEDAKRALKLLVTHADLSQHSVYVAMLALNAIDAADNRAQPIREAIQALPRKGPNVPRRMGAYVGNLIKKILADFEA